MFTVKKDTTFVGVSELRFNLDKILNEAKKHKVLIKRRDKPIAVLLDLKRYSEIEQILDLIEDTALGYLAYQRETQSKPKDYINIEKAIKILNE